MGPAASLAGRDLGQDFEGKDGWRMYHGEVVPGFPQHPHRGFETVTVVRRGLLDHSDSLGAAARYGGGDVQWLTAGSGIMHAEMFPLLERQRANPLELFQIWLNLPRATRWSSRTSRCCGATPIPQHDRRATARGARPRSRSIGRAIRRRARAAAAAEVVGGAARTATSRSGRSRWRPARAGRCPRAPGTNRSLYFFRGNGARRRRPRGRRRPPRRAAPRAATSRSTAGPDETELLLLQGRPIGEPVVQHGPFVMNTQAEIQQAFADYQRTRFGGWPWPSDDPVHAREEGRFARRPDGKIERPA